MAETLRPQVTIAEQISQLVNSGTNPVTVGLVGVSAQGATDKFQSFNNISDLENEYGANTGRGAELVAIARVLFQNGASRVRARSVGYPVATQAPTTLSANALAGATTITVTSVTGLTTGNFIYIGSYIAGFQFEEYREITNVVGTTVTLDEALQFDHVSGESVVEMTAKTDTDYAAAFADLENDKEIDIAVIDSDVTAIVSDFIDAIDNSNAKSNKRYGIYGQPRGTSQANAIVSTSGTDNQNITGVFPTLTDSVGKFLTGAYTAAATAGAIVNRGIPSPNMNFLTLQGFSGVETVITDFDACINGGLSPVELTQDGAIRVSRLMTTSQTINSIDSDLLEEAAVRLNINRLERDIKRRLETKYLTAGNTKVTRNKIRLDVLEILQAYETNGILAEDEVTGTPGYTDPIVSPDPVDRTKALLAFSVAPVRPLVFIDMFVSINL